MNTDHYAIVVGLSQYSELGPPPAHLKGPENDADAVYAWLIDPDGGALPEENIKRIKSSEFTSPRPTPDDFDPTFKWLKGLAAKNRDAGNGLKVGKRFYFYLSGHGFSTENNEFCLLTGNATDDHIRANLCASLWVTSLRNASYFDEYVLWMDCCMDRRVRSDPQGAPFESKLTSTPSGPLFIGVAARTPLRTVEKKFDDGKVHGIFTWALLKGLYRAKDGETVTALSLSNWLRNALLPSLDEKEAHNPAISKEPAIIMTDERLVLAQPSAQGPQGPSLFQFKVTLRFPPELVGKTARLWSGKPPTAVEFKVKRRIAQDLAPGLYVVDVLGSPCRHGFEVASHEEIDITQTDRPVEERGMGHKFSLDIDPPDPSAGIVVVGTSFELVASGGGRLSVKLPFGIYKIRLRIGRQLVETVILLDRDHRPRILPPPPERSALRAQTDNKSEYGEIALPAITSAAPLPGTIATHEYHIAAAEQASRNVAQNANVTLGKGAALIVMARSWSENDVRPVAKPWAGVEIVNEDGKVLADLAKLGERHENGPQVDPFAICSLALNPGTYYLRHPLADRSRIEQSLILPEGWQLEAHLLRRTLKEKTQYPRPVVSLFMRRIGQDWGGPEDIVIEKARVALADNRRILNEELEGLLFEKYKNPIAGIIGAHLLLLEQPKGKRLALLNEIVRNLRKLVGNDHPDVEALSLVCPDRSLRGKGQITFPPIYASSWQLIVAASQRNSKLVPLSLWQRIHAAVSMPPFLVWSVDDHLQKEYRDALAEAAFAYKRTTEEFAPATGAQADLGNLAAATTSGRHVRTDRETEFKHIAAALRLPPVAFRALRDEYKF